MLMQVKQWVLKLPLMMTVPGVLGFGMQGPS